MCKFSASLLAISFFIFTLSACTPISPAQPEYYFTSDAQIKTQNCVTHAQVQSCEDGTISVTVTSPEELQGMKYQYTNDTLYIEYDGLKCTTVTDYLSDSNPFDIIYTVLKASVSSELNIIENDGKDVLYKGRTDSGAFEMCVDADTGAITRITPSFADVQITFESSQ